MCWAKAFKGEEETNYFERVFIIRRRIRGGFDKNHKRRRFAASARLDAEQKQAELRRANQHGPQAVG